jgi:hypothetical protein
MGPPGGARNAVDPRFVSLFSVFEVETPSADSLRAIFQTILAGHLATMPEAVGGLRRMVLVWQGFGLNAASPLLCMTPQPGRNAAVLLEANGLRSSAPPCSGTTAINLAKRALHCAPSSIRADPMHRCAPGWATARP